MSKSKTFPGGVHPDYHKESTAALPIKHALVPQTLVLPVSQHIGIPGEPLVKVGDRVLKGQKIADAAGLVTAPIHASVSGSVLAIEERSNAQGKSTLAIVIENDGQEELAAPIADGKGIDELSPNEIVDIVRAAGIVGLGGAGFPTHVKLMPPPGSKPELVILNGAECEPYLSADHRIMVEKPEAVVYGLRLLMKAIGVARGSICVEANKPDAIAALRAAVAPYAGLDVIPLKVKYPQGLELLMIKAVTGKEVPSGKLPIDIGVIVNNVSTAAAVAEAVQTGRPLTERVVTVAGSQIEHPQNLMVRLGTSFEDLLAECGLRGQPGKIIQGGPMMGTTVSDLSTPVTKVVSGILAISEAEALPLEPTPCIRCGRCVDTCVMRLQPLFLSEFAEHGMIDQAEAYHVLDCRECGCCSFICPARRPLLQNIRLAKSAIMAKRRK